MDSKKAISYLSLLGLLILCGTLFFWRLDAYALFNETEAKQAEIARQIWVRQDWITPSYNNEAYFDKLILLHWFIALGFPILGLNEWAVRMPSAIAATLPIAVGIKDSSLNFYSRLDYIERVESPSQLSSSCDQAKRLILIIKQKTLQERCLNLATQKPITIADDYQVFAIPSEICQSTIRATEAKCQNQVEF